MWVGEGVVGVGKLARWGKGWRIGSGNRGIGTVGVRVGDLERDCGVEEREGVLRVLGVEVSERI